MVIQTIVILLPLITQVLSAPSGCVECNLYIKHFQTGTQASGSVQDHGDLTQTSARLQGLDYSRPGTWSEHNDYNTDNGYGKVHEEQGQYVSGPKTVRYYKKNYSSSYSTGYPNAAGLSEIEQDNYRHDYIPNTEGNFNSQRAYDLIGNSQSIAQQNEYNKIQNRQHTQSSVRRINTQSEKLEDFGEYSGSSQVVQQGASNLNTQIVQEPSYTNVQPGNWSKVNSYKTNGGHGRVFEEEGQFLSGPKKIHYYRKNFTSSSGSSSGISTPEVSEIGLQDIFKKIGVIQKPSNIAQTNIDTYGLTSDNHHNINSNTHRGQIDHGSNLSTMQHNKEQHLTNIANEPYRSPSHNTYGTNNFNIYERHEGYVSQMKPYSQFINPTSGYTNVLSTGNSGYNRNIYSGGNMQQQTDNLQQTELLDSHQSKLVHNQIIDDNLRQNVYNQNSPINLGTPGQVSHYKEHWSSSHRKETLVPQYSADMLHINEQSAQYNNRYRENSFNTAHQTLDKMMTEAALGNIGHNADCKHGTEEHVHTSSQYHRKYKRSPKNDKLSDTQQHQTGKLSQQHIDSSADINVDLFQQTSGKLEFEQQSQHSYQPWRPDKNNEQLEDLTQQTSDSDDLTQQTSGRLEFGDQSEHSYQPWRPDKNNEQLEDLTQKTGEFDDLTQQTSGRLEFGHQSQHSYQPWRPNKNNEQLEDLTQQTSDSDDLTQQTSGRLEFGHQSQHSYQPWRPDKNNEQLEDLTQQTSDSDDLTQQTSGKLEFEQQSQHSYQPWRPDKNNEQLEDLTQQTSDSDDLTQQTSGKLEFGQQSQHPNQSWSSRTDNQQSEDLTQQTSDSDDLTQETSAKLEFGQQSQNFYQPSKPSNSNKQSEDLTQQTGKFDDLTQQTSGKLEFGPQSQNSYQPSRPSNNNKQSEDLTQQTGEFDDLTQQTSGKLEFGPQSQNSYQPSRPSNSNKQSEDLTQQTGKFDDLTQQTSGKFEFGEQSQNSYQPWRPSNNNKQSEDLTQQTGEFEDLTQQTSGKFEFGEQSQNSYQPWRPSNNNKQSEDLTQQTGEFDDLTQQTSGKFEFGEQSQNSYQPWRPSNNNKQSEDLTQQTGEFDDLTQQTSGKFEFGEQSQNSYQPWGPSNNNKQSEDLTQQTGEFDDLTQQTSGKFEFGEQSQNSYQPWRPSNNNKQSEDLTQQTGEFDDLTQQTSGKFEFGEQSQNSYQPWRPSNNNKQSEDLTQQTGEFDDLTQQTSGKFEFGEQSQNSNQRWRPGTNNQQSEDFTQQTGKVEHIPLFANSDRASKSMNTHNSENNIWRNENISQLSNVYDVNRQQVNQQQNEDLPAEQQVSSVPLPKPLGKPKPRSRYSRIGILPNLQIENHNIHNSNNQQTSNPNSNDTSIVNIYELPPKVVPEPDIHNTRDQIIRGDQNKNNFMDTDTLRHRNQQTAANVFNIEGENMDQGNSLYKSNDATVGLQWHYTYHPSDQRQFIQQTDQKDKVRLLEQSSNLDSYYSDHSLDQQETQNKYMFEDPYQQSSNRDNKESELYQKYQETSDNIQKQSQLEFSQQTISEINNKQKHVQSSDTKHNLESRILEAYGGGPYDASHSDDIYSGITINPSATLPPINNVDPWDIREKPREVVLTTNKVTSTPMSVESLNENDKTTSSSSFWSRVGNKITTTFDKAKEKARTIFG